MVTRILLILFMTRYITKVDMPNLVSYLNQHPIFESYGVGCGFDNGYQKDMCLKEIILRA